MILNVCFLRWRGASNRSPSLASLFLRCACFLVCTCIWCFLCSSHRIFRTSDLSLFFTPFLVGVLLKWRLYRSFYLVNKNHRRRKVIPIHFLSKSHYTALNFTLKVKEWMTTLKKEMRQMDREMRSNVFYSLSSVSLFLSPIL